MSVLLDSRKFPIELSLRASECSESVLIASAFVKARALESFLSTVPQRIEVTVVSRWRAADLVSGASDLEVYTICNDRGIKFGISLDFHGKLYLFDNDEIFVGSANLTSRGFSLSQSGNIEFGTRFSASSDDLKVVSRFLNEDVVWINDSIYARLSQQLKQAINESSEKSGFSEFEWPGAVGEILKLPVNNLWMEEVLLHPIDELLAALVESESQLHDLELLGLLGEEYTESDLVQGFKRSKFYRWLCKQVAQNPGINIGGLSAALHGDLMDDPAPYRREVKQIIVIAFAWLEHIPEQFTVTRHNRTLSVRCK